MECIDCGKPLPERYRGLRCQECVIALVEKMISRQHKLTEEYFLRHMEMNMLDDSGIENR